MLRWLVAGVLTLAVPAVPAGAAEPLVAGWDCGYGAVAGSVEGEWTAVLYGGPVAAADVGLFAPSPFDLVLDNPVDVTVTCEIRTETTGFTYADPAVASATSATTQGVAALPPTAVPYQDTALVASVCTTVVVRDRDGGTHTFYWDTSEAALSTDPGAYCGPIACTTSSCAPWLGDLVNEAVDRANELVLRHVDPLFCATVPLLLGEPGVVSATPEGDVYVNGEHVWDCPPYAP